MAVALHDGYYGCGTGAGRSNRAIIEIIVGLLPAGVRLVVLPVRLDPTSSEYDPDWHATTIALLAGVGAEVIPVDNGTGGQARFGWARPVPAARRRHRRRPRPSDPAGRGAFIDHGL
ncbi:hypothetical protein GZH49_37625 [Nocardia terpenica]